MHDELVLDEVEAVRLRLVGVRDHLLDFWRWRQVRDGARAARFITNNIIMHNARGTPGRFGVEELRQSVVSICLIWQKTYYPYRHTRDACYIGILSMEVAPTVYEGANLTIV